MVTIGLIYIGTYAQADTDETNWTNENDFVFAGTHDKSVLKHVTTTVTTPLNDGIVYDDDLGQTSSQITYDLGNGAVTATQDMVAAYSVSIKLGDGSTINTVVNVIQLTNGVTFINKNADGLPLDNLSIQSITLGAVVEENAMGWMTVRSVNGARIVCFAGGTLISTPTGECRVETLKPGDWVLTQDHGPQVVLWCAAQVACGQGNAAPIIIPPHALGPGVPKRVLRLSPQHRVLLRSDHAVPLAGADEVLVAAKHLIGLNGIDQAPSAGCISYYHLLCARHELLIADGAVCESFFPGPMALAALSDPDRDHLQTVLRCENITIAAYEICRPVLRGRPLRRLLKDFDPARAVRMVGVASGVMTKSLPTSAMLHP